MKGDAQIAVGVQFAGGDDGFAGADRIEHFEQEETAVVQLEGCLLYTSRCV